MKLLDAASDRKLSFEDQKTGPWGASQWMEVSDTPSGKLVAGNERPRARGRVCTHSGRGLFPAPLPLSTRLRGRGRGPRRKVWEGEVGRAAARNLWLPPPHPDPLRPRAEREIFGV